MPPGADLPNEQDLANSNCILYYTSPIPATPVLYSFGGTVRLAAVTMALQQRHTGSPFPATTASTP